MPPLAMWLISDIAHEVVYRLKEGNSTKMAVFIEADGMS
jgi:hypothetical protein